MPDKNKNIPIDTPDYLKGYIGVDPILTGDLTAGGPETPYAGAIGHTDFGNSEYDKITSTSLESIYNGDYKYFRGEQQNGLAQLGLGALRAVAKAGIETLKTPGYLYALGSSLGEETLDQSLNNAWLNGLESLDSSIKEELPVYQSYKSGKGGIIDNITSTSFWASDGADGVGYLLGMMAPGAALKGLGLAGRLSKIPKISKALANNIELGTNTILNSSLEAMAEAKGVADKLKADGVDQNKIADAAYDTFMANMALLLVPNAIMNKALLGRFNNERKVLDSFKTPDGKLVLNPIAKKTVVTDYIKAGAIGVGSEGFMEEGGQTSIENYETAKAKGLTNKKFISGVLEEYLNTLTTTEGQKAIVLGGVLGSLGNLVGKKRELKSEESVKNKISSLIQNNLDGFDIENDVFERNEDGSIKYENNKPVINNTNLIKAASSMLNEVQEEQAKTAAALLGNKTLHDYIANNQFTRYAIPFLKMGEEGLEILNYHIDNASNTVQFSREKSLLENNGDIFNENTYKHSLKTKAKELYEMYNSTINSADNLSFIDQLESNKDIANNYKNDILNKAFKEYSKQLFYTTTIKELEKDLLSWTNSDKAYLPQTELTVTNINNKIKNLNLLLENSKELYKGLFDINAHKEAIKNYKEEEVRLNEEAKKASQESNKTGQSKPVVSPIVDNTVSNTDTTDQEDSDITDFYEPPVDSIYSIEPNEDGSYHVYDPKGDIVYKNLSQKEAEEKMSFLNSSITDNTTQTIVPTDIEAKKADIERRRQEELNQQTDAGYSIIALDYLFTGGRDVILSTDYLLQALVGGFTYSAKEINDIRNKYADKLGNIKDDINSDVYNQMMNEIRDVINKNYNDSKATEIFDKILKNATGFTNREGNQTSIELDKLNEQNESKINAKYDAELNALEEASTSAKKADIERRRQEELSIVLKSFDEQIATWKEIKEYTGVNTAGEALDGIYDRADREGRVDRKRIPGQATYTFTEKEQKLIDFLNQKVGAASMADSLDSYIKELEDRKEKQRISRSDKNKAGKINTKYDAELAALEENKPTQLTETEEDASNTITGDSPGTADIQLEIALNNNKETSVSTTSRTFESKRPLAVMMKLYNGVKETIGKFKVYKWTRDKDNEVELVANNKVTFKVNSPEFVSVGDTVEYRIVELTADEKTDNDLNIQNSINNMQKYPAGTYTAEDIAFTDRESIGIFKDDELIGFVALPHFVDYNVNDEYYTAKLEARKNLIKERKVILEGLKKGKVVTQIAEKGMGKLLTRSTTGKNPMLAIPKEGRLVDTFEGKHLFVYDNGDPGSGNGLIYDGDLDSVYGKSANKVRDILKTLGSISFANKDGNGKGRIYKVVRTANGSYYVIPMYTTTIGGVKEAIDNITNAFLTYTGYAGLISEINKYAFAHSTTNPKYKDKSNANAIKIDVEGKKVEVAGTTYDIADIKSSPIILSKFKESLGKIRHNVAVKQMNNAAYQEYLLDNGILTTNAYLDIKSGEYYVQPYIELKSLSEGVSNTETESFTGDKFPSNTVINPSDNDDIDNYNIPLNNKNPLSTTKFSGDLSKSFKVLSKILPGLTIADMKEAAKVKPNIKDTYGMFKDMLIYLFDGAVDKTVYHEAFHGVFRNMLSDNDRKVILKESESKYTKYTKEDLEVLKSLPGNETATQEELIQLYYEEKLADSFAEYLDFKVNRSLGQKILDFFKNIVKLFNVFKDRTDSQIDSLFEAISVGQYATKSKMANRVLDDKKFNTSAYKRVNTNLPVSVEMARIKSIADQYLAEFMSLRASGKDPNTINADDIFDKIKQQYLKVFKESTGDIKGIAAYVYQSFDASKGNTNNFIEAVKREIASRKINIKGVFISKNAEVNLAENESAEEQDNDATLTQGNATKEYGQEMTAISGIKTATDSLKLFLSTIPMKDGDKIMKDSFGFTMYHPYDKLYYFIEKNTAFKGTTKLSEQLSLLRELSVYNPEYAQIVEALDSIADPKMKAAITRQFATNFSKQVLSYKIVLFDRVGKGFSFKIFDPNRKHARRELDDKWRRTNLQDPTNKHIDNAEYREFNEKEGRYFYKTENLARDINNPEFLQKATSDINYFFTMSRNVGIDFDYTTLEKIWSVDKTALVEEFQKYIHAVVINNPVNINKHIKNIINKSAIAESELFTLSFNNAENETVYAVQNQSFASRVAKIFSGDGSANTYFKELARDPLTANLSLKHKIQSGEFKDGFNSNYKLFYMGGLKPKQDSKAGKNFNKIHKDDYSAICLHLFLNEKSDDKTTEGNKQLTAIYPPIIPAEKGLSAMYEGPKYSIDLIENGNSYDINPNNSIVAMFYQRFVAEAKRMQNAILDVDKNITPIERYHYTGNTAEFNTENGNAYNFWTIEFKDTKGKQYTHSVTKKIIKYLKDNKDNPNAVEDLHKLDPTLYSSVQAGLLNALNYEFKAQLKEWESKDIINRSKDGKLTSSILNKPNLTNKEYYQIAAEYSLNTWLFNIENSLLLNGDPAFYGGKADLGKRFYQSSSMLKKFDTEQVINNPEFPLLGTGSIRFNIVNDIMYSSKSGEDIKELTKDMPNADKIAEIFRDNYEVSAKGKDPINATDAQVLVSLKLFKELKNAFGDLSTDTASIKPFIYGLQWSDVYKRYIPVQVKCSIMPLTDEYVNMNPLMAEEKRKMDADPSYPQAIGFKSAFKAIIPTPATLGEETISSIDIDISSFGLQQDNPNHAIDDTNSALRQFKMLPYGMLENDKVYYTENGKDYTGLELKNILEELESANLREANETLKEKFNSRKKDLNELIQESVTKRGATSVVEKIYEVDAKGDFKYSLDLVSHRQVIQMLSSLFSKNVTRQEFKGGSHVQATSLGFKGNLLEQQEGLTPEQLKLQSNLQYIKKDPKDPNSITYVDIALPATAKAFSQFINEDGTIKDSMPEELRNIIIYRIPTEDAHSMMVCRVKYFLPESYGNLILMPYEVTMQFGADFDFDKTFFITKWFNHNPKSNKFYIPKYSNSITKEAIDKRYKDKAYELLKYNKNARDLVSNKKEQIKTFLTKFPNSEVEYSFMEDAIPVLVEEGYFPSIEEFSQLPIESQNTKEARDNKIIDIYMSMLRHKNMLQSLISPSGPGKLEDIAKKAMTYYDAEGKKQLYKEDKGNFFLARTQEQLKDIFHSISMLKSIAAIHVTGHSWFAKGDVKIDPIKVLNNGKIETYESLSNTLSVNGDKIVGELGNMLAVVLDAVKKPELLHSIGINMQTLNEWSLLVRTGMGVETASMLTAQHAIKEYARLSAANAKQLKGEDYNAVYIDNLINKYFDLYLKVYDIIPAEHPFKNEEANASAKYNRPDIVKVNKTIDVWSLEKYTAPEIVTETYLNGTEKDSIDAATFYKTQISALLLMKDITKTSKLLGETNKYFSINKEVGPNFEDINDKLLYFNEILTEAEPKLPGLRELLTSPLLASYREVYENAYIEIQKHFGFASDFYNTIKDSIGKSQYAGNLRSIKSENREIINNFIRTYLDANNTFKNLYNGDYTITDQDIISEIGLITLAGKYTKRKFKLLGEKEITEEDLHILRKYAIFTNIEIKTMPNSDVKIIQLKTDRLEKAEKERIIESLTALYNSEYKGLAEALVYHSVKNTGLYMGINSYSNLIDPDIAVAMGLQQDRLETRIKLTKDRSEILNPYIMDRLKDQLVRNYPKMLTRVFKNKATKEPLFTTGDNNTIILNASTNDNSITQLLPKEESLPIKYIRYIGNDNIVKLYRLKTTEKDIDLLAPVKEQLFVYEEVSILGKENTVLEINPFKDINESKFPLNNYREFSKDKAEELADVNDFYEASEISTDIVEYNESDEDEDITQFYENIDSNVSKDLGDEPLIENVTNYEANTFETIFTPEEQNTILTNYIESYKKTGVVVAKEDIMKAIKEAFIRNPKETEDKLRECYL